MSPETEGPVVVADHSIQSDRSDTKNTRSTGAAVFWTPLLSIVLHVQKRERDWERMRVDFDSG